MVNDMKVLKLQVYGLCMVPFSPSGIAVLGRRAGCKSANTHLQLQEVGLGLHSSVRIGDWMWVCSYAE